MATTTVVRTGLRATVVQGVTWAWSNAWLWSAGSQALTSGLSLITSIIAARMLGVDRFGDFVLMQAGVQVLVGLQSQLISSPMAIIAGERKRSRHYFGAITRAILIMALLIGAAAAAYSFTLNRPGGHTALALASFIFAAGIVVQDATKRILFALERPRSAFLCELLRQILFFGFLVIAYWRFGASTEMLLVCIGLSMIIAAWPLLLFLRKSLRGDLRRAIAFRHWKLGSWLMLVVLVSMAHEQFVTIFAGAWIGEQAAAGLRSAQVLLGPMLVFMSSLENIVPRRAAGHFRSRGEAALSGYLWRILWWSELPVILVCLGIIVYARELLVLFFGQSFATFAPVVSIIAMGPPIILARELASTYLRATGQTFGIFIAFTASSIATLAVIYPLVGQFSETGAAMAINVGHGVSTIFVIAAALKARRAIRSA
ncbi:polysaccharide biosynthesis protein [Variibacter gotjawalensis]|uniref:Polysaccharide biosynthesis protein n=1 Tax=Variibacter gotjawalensis TaxID=1333996 RepID=A0A0S3PX57_9BRAD|nr:lipopolysaccharide biosynthesis protein [Variibacter gotjawalensis]NIK46295.1 O-antigen/teichoic acid export membrane protein [Variibacter gotjawalensis]RZS48210.1 O-antigen/teichoic acid export membrane protein [Variibacter gotjawalensis]BAT60467.1 polysaccharide biosynthesis protein [Variibacter gotjawalensis]